MKSRSSERGVTLWFPLIEAWSELLLLSSAHQLGQGDGDHERAAVEHLPDERADDQKDGGERRQLIGDAPHRVRRALSASIEDASQSAEEPGSDKASDADTIGVDAAQPGHLAPATDEKNAPAERGVFEQVPDKSGENDRVVKLERDAEEAVDDDRIHERRRNAADRHGVAEPKRGPMQKRGGAKRDDQRVNTEDRDQEAVDDADCNPERKRCNHSPADADPVIDVEDSNQHRRQRHGERDREVKVVGRQGNEEPERDNDKNGLG